MGECKYCATCFDKNKDMEFFAESQAPVFLGRLYLRAGISGKKEMEINISDESGNHSAVFTLKDIMYCPMCGKKLNG